jgi:Tfp pilus assembly protein PilN
VRAVNLIPADERRAGSGLAQLSAPTRALVAALAIGLVASLAYVVLANAVTHRRDRLAEVEAEARAATAQAAALQPYADVADLRQQSVAAVRASSATRFDWPRLLARLSARVPADVTLLSLSGTLGSAATADAAAQAATTPAGSAPADRTLALTGCTRDHDSVARLMERLRGVPDVTDVTLASSTTAGGNDAARSGGCPRPDQFELTVHLPPFTSAAPAPAPTPAAEPAS